MSKVIDFLQAVRRDPELQEKFAAIGKQYEGREIAEGDYEKVYEEAAPLARSAGIEISFEEYKAWMEQTKSGELADDELAAIAAGNGCTSTEGGYDGGGHK